ncbi:MAG TPA: hypothetical protein VFI28_12610 [Candidatus Limnocylindrales bacterium]|nr:hypothetical protein [Candidatus Limnocylindrales bacterium]
MTSPTDPNRPPRHVEVRGGSWEWRGGWGGDGSGVDSRAVPWLGIILVALGLLFLANELLPAVRIAASLVFLAIGVGLLLLWGARRRAAALYAGTLITALAIPSVLADLGLIVGSGWSTLALGFGFLFIALVRYAETRGWGWQAWLGLILVLVGGASTSTAFATIGWPVILVVLGVLVLVRGASAPRRPGRW